MLKTSILGNATFSGFLPEKVKMSDVIARAVIRNKDEYLFLVVLEGSSPYEFYFVFTADSPRAARMNWKLKVKYPRRAYADFRAFVNSQVRQGRLLKVEIVNAVRLARLMRAEASAAQIRTATCLVAQKQARALQGSTWFSRRNRTFDSLPTSANQVLVYTDLCPECDRKHLTAHWPDGSIRCMGVQELQKNPGLRYAGYRDGIFSFDFFAAVPG